MDNKLSPEDHTKDDPQQKELEIDSQVAKESALQNSNKEIALPTKSNKLSFKESREMGRQQMNKTITKYAETAMHLGQKKKREVEANVKQLFESLKQDMHKSEDEFFGTILSEVETQQITWLWQGRIPLGKITIPDGDPGMGKSLIA